MVARVAQCLVVVGTLVAWPAIARAQEATIGGTVTDSTGGVLPGVTVTAVQTETGNTFLAVTSELGTFRLPVRTGPYTVTLELPGFATLTRTLELLVGRNADLTLQMAPSTVQESVTVTGEAPLLDLTSSSAGGNIDPRQMQELPINGRNWYDLALLAPGNRANAVNQDSPLGRGGTDDAPFLQLNVDGQQVTEVIGQGQPRYSRDAIAEFEFVSNRFDASQGRSMGVQVNAITKSGTNTFAGTLAGYFRDDSMNAADHVAGRVLPYSNQQLSTTVGGPIRRDRIQYFGYVEYQREPRTFTFTTPYPRFNFDLTGNHEEYMGGARVDVQFSPQTRLAVRGNTWHHFAPHGGSGGTNLASASQTPASSVHTERWDHQALGTLTQVLSNRTVNELRVGFARFAFNYTSDVRFDWPPGLLRDDAPDRVRREADFGVPQIRLRSLSIGPTSSIPLMYVLDAYSVRDDLTHSYTARGQHNLKVGGEWVHQPIWQNICNFCFGVLFADRSPLPPNLEQLLPNLLDANTWNLAPLSAITYRYNQNFGNMTLDTPRTNIAGWAQDDWKVTSRLTLNIGVRYDLQMNVFLNEVEFLPWLPSNRSNDMNNLAPRLGAVYSLNDRTVVRGGFGRYFAEVNNSHFTKAFAQQLEVEVLNDGRPDFASNPFNGPVPTYEQALTRVCTPANPFASGCVRRSAGRRILTPNLEVPYSYQALVGVQRQLGTTMGVTADYTFNGTREELSGNGPNLNLSYNPATGLPYPFSDIARRPHPEWGSVIGIWNGGRLNAHALETSFTKRLSNGWQAAATYTLSGLWDAPVPMVPFLDVPLPPDLGSEYALAVTDQRHRAVVNGLWQVGGGFQLSGLYFFGSGQRFATSWGGDLRNIGIAGTARLRADGTIVPRNNFVGKPIHRTDLRVQQTLPLGGRVRVEGLFEVYNLFNHANYGAYTTAESNARYGQPNQLLNVAYVPRTLQLGFRVRF